MTEEEEARLAKLRGGAGQQPITKFTSRIAEQDKKAFKEAVMYWALVCSGTLSFNVLTHHTFKAALEVFSISPIDRKYLAGDFLDLKHAEAVKRRDALVSDAPCVSIAVDCWKRRGVNDGNKVIGMCINLPDGGSTFADWVATQGESITAAVLKGALLGVIEQLGGEDKVAGIVQDGESAGVRAGKDIEAEYPRIVAYWCQAHVMNLLIKDITALDPLIGWVLDGTHDIITFIHAHTDVRQRLRTEQVLLYETIYELPPGCDTRFATKALELNKLLKSVDALKALAADADVYGKYTESRAASQHSKAALLRMCNENFYIAARCVQDLMQPIADIIHHMEADRAALSHMRRVWGFLEDHVSSWERRRHLGLSWDARAPAVPDLPPAAAHALTQAVVKRRKDCAHPALSLAYVLDLRFYTKVAPGLFRPNTEFLKNDKEEDQRVKDLIARLAGTAGGSALVEWERLSRSGCRERAIDGVMNAATIDENGWKIVGSLEDVLLTWHALGGVFPELSKIAVRLLSLHCTSCSVERLWSVLRNVKRDNRTRLGTEKTKKLIMVGADERLRHAKEQEGTAEYLLESLIDF